MPTLPTYSNARIARYIGEGYHHADLHWNLGATGLFPQAGVLSYDTSGLSAPRAALARQALGLYGTVLGIDFVAVAGGGTSWPDIRFEDRGTSAVTRVAPAIGDPSVLAKAVVYVPAGWEGGGSTTGNFVFQTFLHEIGHALGLGHAGPYNGSATYVTSTGDPAYGEDSNVYLNDSWQASVMSYFDQDENTTVAADRAFLISPMVADWIALEAKYGLDAFRGATVWGFDTTIQGSLYASLARFAHRSAFTLVDSGGTDTLDVSGYGARQRIDLAPESHSDIGGLVGNMGIARGTLIENAVGGAGGDVIRGNGAANGLRGGRGDDRLEGGPGTDRLHGGVGADTLAGGNGADALTGFGGRDALLGGAGADRFVFAATSESPAAAGASDAIRAGGGAPAFEGAGAGPGDRIELAGIDANAVRPGEQAFAFGGPGGGRGHVWCAESGTTTVVYADTDGHGADFRLDILDGGVTAAAYTAADFLL